MIEKWGIRQRIITLSLLPAVTVALCLGVFLVNSHLHYIQQVILADSERIAQQLVPAAEDALAKQDSVFLRNLANMAAQHPSVRLVEFTDNTGRLLATSGAIFAAPTQQQVNPGTVLSELFNVAEPPPASAIVYPTVRSLTPANIEQPAPLGKIYVYISPEQLANRQIEAIGQGVLIMLLAIAISLVIGTQTAKTVTNPILRLTKGVKAMEQGRLDTRVEETSGGEIGTLETGINAMSSALERAHEELQEQIQQATSDLRETLEAVEIQNVELDIARKRALEASKVKSEFLANMSHEIRTPINGIIGFTDIMTHTQMDDEQRDYLNTIKESSTNLLTIINDILDFSKMEAGKLVIDNVAFDLRDCVEEVFALLAPPAYGKGLELVHLIYSDVPLKLYGDPIRIRQVLTNLVHNAVKFTPQGRIVVRVMLDDDTDKDALLRVTVTDTGIGLNQADQARLFKAFSQADTSATRRFGGTGLGLIISKKLISQMGGNIGLESEPEKGSTFWFTLRCTKQRESTQPVSRQEPLYKRRVLLYDEQALSRLAIRHIFDSWGVEVKEVADRQRFISMISVEKNWDAAVVGLSRQELNSQTFRDLMVKFPMLKVPVIVLANTVDRNELRTLYQQGAKVALSKSVRRHTLYREVVRLLSPETVLPAPSEQETTPTTGVRSTEPAMVNSISNTEQKTQILVVDDNHINRKLVTTLVKQHDVHPVEAHDGQDAVNLCKDHYFPLIFMDIHMPILSGEEATLKIRELYKNKPTKIIALTANAMPGEKERLLQNGLDAVVIKPIQEDQIASLIREIKNPAATPLAEPEPEPEIIEQVPTEPTTTINIEHLLSNNSIAANNQKLAKELLTMLQAELPNHKTLINSAAKSGELVELKDEVHKLHGAARVCGVAKLTEASKELEVLASLGNKNAIEDALKALNSCIEEIETAEF